MSAPRFLRDALATALSQYLARFALLARGVAAAAALGPVGYGHWNALHLVLDYGAYASFGALQGLELRLPAAIARGDGEAARRLMRAAWTVVVFGAAGFAAVVVTLLAFGGGMLTAGWGWGAPVLMLAAAALQLALLYHVSSLRSQGAFTTVSGGLALQAVVGGGLGLALVWRHGVWGLIGGWLAGSMLALAWMRRDRARVPLAAGGAAEGVRLAGAGVAIFGFFATSLVLRSLDRLAFVTLAGAEGLGLYSLGLMVAGLVLYLPEAAAAVLFPRIAAAADGARDVARTRDEVVRAQRALTVLLPVAVALGIVWAAPAVAWLLPAFREGVVALQILALAALLLAAGTLPAYYLLGTGESRRLLALGAGATAVTGILVFATATLAPRPAPIAAARSLVVVAGYAPVLWWLARGLGLRRLLGSRAGGKVAA